jgi:hypothetical protein
MGSSGAICGYHYSLPEKRIKTSSLVFHATLISASYTCGEENLIMYYMKKVLFFVLGIVFFVFPFHADAGYPPYYTSDIRIIKEVRTQGSGYAKHIQAHSGDVVEFKITVTCVGGQISDVIIRDSFDTGAMSYMDGSIAVNGQPAQPGLSSTGLRFSCQNGVPIVITYAARVIPYATNGVSATVTATGPNGANSTDTVQINIIATNYNNTYCGANGYNGAYPSNSCYGNTQYYNNNDPYYTPSTRYNDSYYNNAYNDPYYTNNYYYDYPTVPAPENYYSYGNRNGVVPTAYVNPPQNQQYFVAPQTGANKAKPIYALLFGALLVGITVLIRYFGKLKSVIFK